MIINTIVVAPIGTNCYILACEKTGECVCIDPGGEPEKILNLIDEQKYSLKYIINTHAHFDHVGGVNTIKTEKNVPFMLHRSDEPFLEDGAFEASLRSFGLSGMSPPTIDEFIDPNQRYSFGECQFSVLETPGHSPGGVCFLFDKQVFVGDTLFSGSIGRTDLPGGDMGTLMESIRTKLMSLSDDIIVYCGHMGSTTIGKERTYNPFNSYWQ